MTRTQRQVLLSFSAGVFVVFLGAFLVTPAARRGAVRPDSIEELAAYASNHPADWLAFGAIADRALETALPGRRELWRASYEHSLRLAPNRQNAAAAFVRGGLFHWYELGAPDRREVLRIAAPMLRETRFFMSMHRPFWELTRDLDYLRRNAPRAEEPLMALRDLAATNGLFEHYRALRTDVNRVRAEKLVRSAGVLDARELILLLPNPITRADEPVVRRVLEALKRRPLDAFTAAGVHERASELAEFAIRHGIGPLDGLDVLVETRDVPVAKRIRLARALGREDSVKLLAAQNSTGPPAGTWVGTCGTTDLCTAVTATIETADAIRLRMDVVQTDEVNPYVEIYVDDERVAEGPVDRSRTFVLPVRKAGPHHVEIRLANPQTRNRVQRRLRLS